MHYNKVQTKQIITLKTLQRATIMDITIFI